jgi:hypothetical protein
MIYHKPFTPAQRREAAREYQLFRNNVRELRKAFPPLTKMQKDAFKEYEDRVMKIGQELLKVDAKISVAELNARIELARHAMTQYFKARYFDL